MLPGQSDKTEVFSEPEAKLRDALLEHFLKYPEYILLRWNLSIYAVLIKGDAARMDELIGRCTEAVRQQYETYAPGQSWYVAVGRPTQRLSTLSDCFEEASRMWACRYILPRQHILTADSLAGLAGTDDDTSLDHLSVEKLAPEILLDVMKGASPQDIPGFVNGYIHGVEEALSSKPFCQFLMLNVRFTATAFIESLELSRMEFLSSLSCLDMVGQNVTIADLEAYISEILLRAIEFRDRASSGQLHSLLRQAVSYLDRHYADEALSLNQVAREVNISANYLSALFSQEMGATFTEYVTGRRMEKAKELLRTTDKRSGEVAAAVGFNVIFLIAPVITLVLLIVHNSQYSRLLHNVTRASEFNQDFKENIDLKMYYYVIESQYSEGLPISEVEDAKDLARSLLDTTDHKDSLEAITSVLDLCENLEEKIHQIERTENYDNKQTQLENNVYVLTALIQEYMYNYLYFESAQLNVLQQQINRQLVAEILAATILMLALIVVLVRQSFRLGRSVTAPIMELCQRAQDVAGGDLTVREPVQSGTYEIRTLGESIEQMIGRLNAQIEESTQKQESLRRMELALLQAQINPRFLYNTLDMINSY